jgi:NAD(P)-dependent dehydrogenase (short-subunit alcohol dehydrogenase family)
MTVFDLSGEVAVVIGGTGVLGGALAEGLAQAGAKVAVLGRNPQRGEARVQSIRQQGGTASFIVADAMDRHSLELARGEIEQQLGSVAILSMPPGGTTPKSP